MDITQHFIVSRPIDEVWALFLDVPGLSRCLPGAELTEDRGDGSYDGRVTVKLGPITAAFDGTATVEVHPDTQSLTIKGRGVDRAGGSQARVEVTVDVSSVDEARTEVSIDSKVTLAGPIAQFGRTGLVNEVSKRLIGEFSDCIHKKLDAGSEGEASEIRAAEVRGLSLFFASSWSAFRRWITGLFSRK